MAVLQKGDTVALVACSNGFARTSQDKMRKLKQALEDMGLFVCISPYLYEKDGLISGTAKQKAAALMAFYEDTKVKAIFDISGGDLANEVLSYLDYDKITKHKKPFFGYSDVTTVINSIYTKTGEKGYLYQIRNLVGTHKETQQRQFKETFFDDQTTLYQFPYRFVQGEEIDGEVVGGNIRCLLKLAGTPYLPDFQDKILFLESLNGTVAQMTTYLNQYKQIGVFEKVKGIILGNFTKMEESSASPTMEQLVVDILDNEAMPVVKTYQIGHGHDSKCIVIGENIYFKGRDSKKGRE